MTSNLYISARLIGIFIFGGVLFCYPILTMFSINAMLYGIPILYMYIFAAWIGLIFLIYLATRKNKKAKLPKLSDAILPTDSLD